MKYRRFKYHNKFLIVDEHGDLIEYRLYEEKAATIEAIYNLIGEDVYDAVNMGAETTLTTEQCAALKKILEEA